MDTVPGGGSYDGQVGAAEALEVALTLLHHRVELRHPLEAVIFQNEEGGKTGSRALVGRVEPHELDIVTASGLTIVTVRGARNHAGTTPWPSAGVGASASSPWIKPPEHRERRGAGLARRDER